MVGEFTRIDDIQIQIKSTTQLVSLLDEHEMLHLLPFLPMSTLFQLVNSGFIQLPYFKNNMPSPIARPISKLSYLRRNVFNSEFLRLRK